MMSNFDVNSCIIGFKHLEHISAVNFTKCVKSGDHKHVFVPVEGSKRTDRRFTMELLRCYLCEKLTYTIEYA